MTDLKQVQAINVRVWYVEGGVYPNRPPQFLAIGKFSDDPAITIGEETKVSAPDPNNFGRDIQIGSVPGESSRATLAIGIRSTVQESILLDWKNKRCRVDIFALIGKCGNPQDFTEGGEKYVYFPDGKISGHAYENFGAYGLDENNPTNESVPMTAEDYYEFLYERQDQIGSSVTVRQIMTIHVVKGDDCDNCPDQCTKVIMTMAGASATPGTQPSLLYSSDGGETFSQQTIMTLFSNEVISDDDVIGDNYIIISNTANELHWTDITELYEGVNTWNQVPTGFVAGKNVNAMTHADVRHIWIVGNGGYIYFTSNFKVGVSVQDAGIATAQNLNVVHAYDSKNVLAVGNSNAVVYTSNGGSTWESVTGPAIGVNLGACWMWDANTWLVGEGAGGTGKLWLTTNSGITWSQIGLPATYSRIYEIKFVSEAEGYLLASDGSKTYVLRTITAGYEWVVLPQGKKGVPVGNTWLTHLAVCSKFGNEAYAVGLASNGTAGIAVKMSAG